jgi:glycosyltransferase involved in cell wall biosynthesis
VLAGIPKLVFETMNLGKNHPLRVAVLFWELPVYLSACLKTLADKYGAQVCAVRRRTQARHSWSEEQFAWIRPHLHTVPDAPLSQRVHAVKKIVENFQPTVLLSSGWTIPEYLLGAFLAKRGGTFTICSLDSQWSGSLKQRLSIIASPIAVQAFDLFWVPGPLQSAYIRKYGVDESRIGYGFYCCDTTLYSAAYEKRQEYLRSNGYPRRFLFVGNFIEKKGIRQLLDAYRSYRALIADPWELVCIGGGPLASLLNKEPGVTCLPFLQPQELVNHYVQAGVFILPSLHEPHGVVVHEAATVGLPILCSAKAGAALDFVRDGFNGWLFTPHNSEYLSHIMLSISYKQHDLMIMGERSRRLAMNLTCDTWADYLVNRTSLKG